MLAWFFATRAWTSRYLLCDLFSGELREDELLRQASVLQLVLIVPLPGGLCLDGLQSSHCQKEPKIRNEGAF